MFKGKSLYASGASANEIKASHIANLSRPLTMGAEENTFYVANVYMQSEQGTHGYYNKRTFHGSQLALAFRVSPLQPGVRPPL